MDAQVGKAIAGVGVVLALVAIWTNALAGQSYWSLDGTLGAFMLIMVILGALAVATGQNRAVLVIGGILLGFYGFYPAATATGQWHLLDAGAWLGLCGGALMTAGALAILAPAWMSTRTGATVETSAAALAAIGLVLSFVAIWPKADQDGSYWNAPSLGHSLAIVMIILAVAAALGLVGAVMMHSTAAAGLAATAGVILCGTLLFVPVGDAFNQLGQLRLGGWLGVFGGIFLAAGTMKLTRTAITTRPAPTPAIPTQSPTT